MPAQAPQAPAPTPMPMAQQPTQSETASPQQQGGPNFISQESLIDEREVAYEGAFKDTAYNVFSIKYPDLVPSIVTFKVIKSAIDDGDGVGAFILSNQGETLYVPIVMSSNQMKPMEVIYSKRMDKFLPFNRDWMRIIMSTAQQTLGKGTQAPEFLPGDVDVSRLIVPPMDGRTAYAMDLSDVDHLELIKQASNSVKTQYRELLKAHPEFLKFAVEHFGKDALVDSLQTQVEKVASVEDHGSLAVATLDTPASTIKEVFGKEASDVMTKLAKKGYALKDSRVDLAKVSRHDFAMKLEEPTQTGVYTIYKSDGSMETALVVVTPKDILDRDHEPYLSMRSSFDPTRNVDRTELLVVRENGDYFYTHRLIATMIAESNLGGKFGAAIKADSTAGAINKTNIMFVKRDEKHLVATKPFYVTKTEVTKDGHKKYVKTDDFGTSSKYIGREKSKDSSYAYEVLHADAGGKQIVKPDGTNLTIVPKSWKAVRMGERMHRPDYLSSPSEVLHFVQQKLNDRGAKTVKVASLGHGQFAVNNAAIGDKLETIIKIAQDFSVHADAAEQMLNGMDHVGDTASFFVVNTEKTGSIFSGGADGSQLPPDMAQQMAQQAQAPDPGAVPPGQSMVPVPQGQVQTPPPGPAPGGPAPQGDPSMMQAGVNTKDPNLYSLGALNYLSQNPDVRDLLSSYSPNLEKALDNIGRMLLVFWIRGSKTKAELGEETYFTAEDALRTTFKSLGSLLLKINRQTSAMPDAASM